MNYENVRCPKCGYNKIKTNYDRMWGAIEYLCLRCKYAWERMTDN